MIGSKRFYLCWNLLSCIGKTYFDKFALDKSSLTVPAEEGQPVGVLGQRHKRYLKEHRPALYNALLLSGNLNSYLADIDQQAQERLDTIIQQTAQSQGVTEVLKAADQMAWVGRMNNIRASAMEIVNKEIIYA